MADISRDVLLFVKPKVRDTSLNMYVVADYLFFQTSETSVHIGKWVYRDGMYIWVEGYIQRRWDRVDEDVWIATEGWWIPVDDEMLVWEPCTL